MSGSEKTPRPCPHAMRPPGSEGTGNGSGKCMRKDVYVDAKERQLKVQERQQKVKERQ